MSAPGRPCCVSHQTRPFFLTVTKTAFSLTTRLLAVRLFTGPRSCARTILFPLGKIDNSERRGFPNPSQWPHRLVTGEGARGHAHLHGENLVGNLGPTELPQTVLQPGTRTVHRSFPEVLPPLLALPTSCSVSVSSITSLHIAVCSFQENFHRAIC